jgi:hypothetical protein
MSEELEFYNLLLPNERRQILDTLLSSMIKITLKIKHTHQTTFLLKKRNENEYLLNNTIAGSFRDERISGSFEIQKDKYFFKTSLTTFSDGTSILIPTDIFKLQRRNNFRVAVPNGVFYSAEILWVNGQYWDKKIDVVDMSLGGCQIHFEQNNLVVQSGDEIQLRIKMLDLEEESITGQIKHVVNLTKSGKTQLGIEFKNPVGDLLTDLQSLLIHLDRIQRGKRYE